VPVFAAAAALCAALLGFLAAREGPSRAALLRMGGASHTARSLAAHALADSPASTPTSSASSPIAVWRTRLVVHGPPHGVVFVQGVPVGRTGEELDVPCGIGYVRIGPSPIRGAMPTVSWLSEGRSVNLPCGGTLVRKP